MERPRSAGPFLLSQSSKSTADYNSRNRFDKPVLGLLEEFDDLVPCDRWEAFEKLVDRVASLKIIKQRLHRHARPAKDRGTTHDLGIADYNWLLHLRHFTRQGMPQQSGWAWIDRQD